LASLAALPAEAMLRKAFIRTGKASPPPERYAQRQRKFVEIIGLFQKLKFWNRPHW
jgi:hypothetical protein